MRETVVRAKAAGIAAVSDVALMKRLRKAEGGCMVFAWRCCKEAGGRCRPKRAVLTYARWMER